MTKPKPKPLAFDKKPAKAGQLDGNTVNGKPTGLLPIVPMPSPKKSK